MTSIGQLGEQFVAQWLTTRGWIILQQRWRCRWGEIDLIAKPKKENFISFVEVKTRSSGNWDDDGILAVTPQKQVKLSQAAAYFLADYPHLAEVPCRFDVVLVHYQKSQEIKRTKIETAITLGQPIQWQGYQFTLIEYIEAAFD